MKDRAVRQTRETRNPSTMNLFALISALVIAAVLAAVTLVAAIWRDISVTWKAVRNRVTRKMVTLSDLSEMDRAASNLTRRTLQFPRLDWLENGRI